MLVLTRKCGEQIMIDKGKIQIKVLYGRRGIVALGILAPDDIEVDRKEIFLRKMASTQPRLK
ncbi:vir region protein [Legionella rubrilucens]|uniref:Translational regulator CsrA n=1 Tax=Legionella rubrilucens TaxID=458 RepID=A0A0W0XXY4_9GAMM|nr:carbon storage regulator [Legionella rubrilucens]KTD49608.1 vir region protein [Legionella rubrilucens]